MAPYAVPSFLLLITMYATPISLEDPRHDQIVDRL